MGKAGVRAISPCNCETDGQHYVCCGAYVIEGEFGAHRHSCPGRTHPLKELKIVLNAGLYHMDSGDGGTDNACDCLRSAAEILNAYFEQLGFDDSGYPPAELAEAERRIARRI